MSNWFTSFFTWLFGGGEESAHPQSDHNWRDAFAKYDPTFKGKIRELYDQAQSAGAFFTSLEDLQISLEMKISEREQEKSDIDREIFSLQEKIASGKVEKAEESSMLRHAERSLMQAGKLNREIDELDTRYSMLMDFVTWLDEIVRKPEAAVEVNAVLWEKLRDEVSQRRSTFETGRVAWREARRHIEADQPDRTAEIRERLLAYGKEKPVKEKTHEEPEKKDEALVREKLMTYGTERKEQEPAPQKEPEKQAPADEPGKGKEKLPEPE